MNTTRENAFQTKSIWLAKASETEYPRLDGTLTCDIAVIGAGITGLTTALLLQRAGKSVVLLEANRIGCGVTGHTTAKLTSLHTLIYAHLEKTFGAPAARSYADANQAGLSLIRSLVHELHIDCQLETQPAITFTRKDEFVADIRAEVEAAARAGLPARFTDQIDLPLSVKGAVLVDDQSQFYPYPYCVALAEEIRRAGGQVLEMSRVTNVDQGDLCTVSSDDGEVVARHVVLATLIPILDRGGFFARVFPSRSYGIAASLNDGACAPEGMYISIDQPTRSVRPLADRRGIVVVGETHKVGQDSDTRDRYAALEAWAREHFPVRSVDYRWSAQDFMSADRLPYIGRMPLGVENILLATGFNKWGLTTGSFAAKIISDLILEHDNPWAALFDARRANLSASATKLISENANVVKHYVGDWIKSFTAPKLEDLPLNAGAIVERDGQKIAAYRDDAGKVHAVSPICSHMGCYVQWNTAERSWDCPCHGSRFDIDGNVLQCPAVKPLASLE